MHGFGVMVLAKSKCGAVEVQSLQCPWWNGHMAMAASIAIRIGKDVASFTGTTVRRTGTIQVQGGGPWTVTSPDRCASLWVKRTFSGAGNLAGGPGNNWYHMDIELKMNDPDMSIGNCNGARRNYLAPINDILFARSDILSLCGRCRFACVGGNLLEQPAVEDAEDPPTAEQACAEANIDLQTASAKCDHVAPAGSFEHDSCMVDYCGSNGEEDVDEEVDALKHFVDDDAEDAAAALLQTADPGDKELCEQLLQHEDAQLDSPEQFKAWCQNDQQFDESDCDRALQLLGPHPWSQERIDSVCDDSALQ